MWTVLLETPAEKVLAKVDADTRRRFNAWAAVVIADGPNGLRVIKGFHDEKLAGKMKHLRSSRLGSHWRVIYFVEESTVTATVEQITHHVYKP